MYTFLNRDLLITGTFCHDIGKIKEFQFSEMGLVNDYSIPGQLLGHLYMGAKEVSEIAESLVEKDFAWPMTFTLNTA